MIFQDLKQTRQFISKSFKDNPRRSLSALYRNVRGSHAVSFYGDYPLVSLILEEAVKNKVNVTDKVLWRLLIQSEDYKNSTLTEKRMWKVSLLESAKGGNENNVLCGRKGEKGLDGRKMVKVSKSTVKHITAGIGGDNT